MVQLIDRTKRAFAELLLPFYSERLDKANHLALVRRWIEENCALTAQLPNRSQLYRFLYEQILRGSDIDFLEFGVYQGSSLREWTAINRNAGSRFWGFDSFRGLPEDWVPGFDRGAYDLGGIAPSIHDPRVTLVKGTFQETLPEFIRAFTPRSRLIVHIDSDLYSSALYCLSQCDSIFVSGTILVFDEFSVPLHEFRAYQDYCAAFLRRFRPIAMVGAGAEQVSLELE